MTSADNKDCNTNGHNNNNNNAELKNAIHHMHKRKKKKIVKFKTATNVTITKQYNGPTSMNEGLDLGKDSS